MRRVNLYYIITAIVALIFILRLGYLQLFSDKYILHANNVSIKREIIFPKRGYIKDRNGKLLAGNVSEYELQVTPALIKNGFDTLGLAKLMRVEPKELAKTLNELKFKKDYLETSTYSIVQGIPREEYAAIQEAIHNYPAFNIIERPRRQYFVNTSGHLLGYIREVDPNYIKKDSLYYEAGDFVGYSGVEKTYEKELRGVKGVKHFKKDRQLKVIGPYNNGKDDIKSISGKDITLTIDYDLQLFAEELMQNKRGGIVAIEPKTGEILALVSSPVINPNDYNTRAGRSKIFNDSIHKSQYDRATQAMYPPGSPFKLFTALSAYEMGVIDSSTRFTCRGGYGIGKRKIACHCGTYWPIDMETAIARSCNNYFSSTYRRIIEKDSLNPERGINEWKGIMSSFGLGNYLNNDLATGSPGLIPDSDYYNHWHGKDKWNGLSIISNGIGQGEILSTPIQLANAGAVIANKGFYYTPHIIKEIEGEPIKDSNFTVPKHSKVKSKYFDVIIEGMKKVILMGTARRIRTPEFTQAGKTGTAQNPHGQDHSIFLNIAPAENPEIVVAVFVENGHYGAKWAAPIASLVAERYLLGEVKRTAMANSMKKGNLQAEYKKQWIREVQEKEWYKVYVRKQDSIRQDSLRKIMIRLDSIKRDSIKNIKPEDIIKSKKKEEEEKKKISEKEKIDKEKKERDKKDKAKQDSIKSANKKASLLSNDSTDIRSNNKR